ncbi:MAG TPA: helicase C-terminal domain-containing protein [Candidatus Acidoferrales bacterium]|jgi:ATP-dependent DNA helicase DinG|nr:helicase C-terminal domain-containing protein [Candidatus Acidoferrales bacterium]
MPKRAKEPKEKVQTVAAALPEPQPESHRERIDARTVAPDVKAPTIADIFGPGGAIEKFMPEGYEHRRSQLEMAELVEAAFQEKRHLIVEAGTGTGKTLAYLIPAIRSGRRVVISTATKSLQEQLFEKDIPFLQKHFAPELKVAVMKGRGNFLCREKVYRMGDQPMLKGLDEVDWFHQIRDWEKVTETGDRAELNFLPDDSDLWAKLDARRDACTGQKCPEFNKCFLTAMHQRAAEADLIIVNHHLFFADLALKQDDFGSVLPEYGAVIFDEAHEIEDVASDFFGKQISNYRFEELARDAEISARVTKAGGAELQKKITRMRERSRTFFEAFPSREGRFPFDKNQRAAFLEQNREAYDALVNALKSLEAEIASLSTKPEEMLNIARRGMELRGELKFLFESSEGNYVYWFERRNKGVFVAATPIDVSALLRERLFEAFETIVLTSATLAVEGRFNFLKQRLGIDMASERVLPSEFDFAEQALLYIPSNLPDVRDAGFPERAAQEIVQLLEISEGRAFCLFTSYSQMKDLHERVRTRVPYPLLLQGSAPRSALLEKFKNTESAVLFATSSFWQGVDVRGDQLSCVIVDKLPFAVPSDPIVAARVKALQEDGRNAFAEYQVPEAVLALKQGFGRLIRSRTDRGVLSILDNRIQRMQYGKIFMESLPAYSTTRDIAAVERFMRKTK